MILKNILARIDLAEPPDLGGLGGGLDFADRGECFPARPFADRRHEIGIGAGNDSVVPAAGTDDDRIVGAGRTARRRVGDAA